MRHRTNVLLLAVALSVAAAASAQTDPPPFDADGTIHVPAHDLKQSDALSEAFRRAYAEQISRIAKRGVKLPAADAPASEWDRYNQDYDRDVLAEAHRWALAHHPVTIERTAIAGVPVSIVAPKGGVAPANDKRILINLHAGGFIVGRGGMGGEVEAIPVAGTGKVKVIAVDYRMFPAHRFPAASEDVEAVYRALLKQYRAEAIGIYGCSAGGTLAGQVIVRLAKKGLPRPGAVGVFCQAPGAFGLSGDSAAWGASGVISSRNFSASSSRVGGRLVPSHYMEGASPDDSQAFPGASDVALARFPPILLLAGERASERSNAILMHSRMLRLRVDSELYIMAGAIHGAVFWGAHDTPEAKDAIDYIWRWFDTRLAR